MLTQQDFCELFEAGHKYRHSMERWNLLAGHPATFFPSPRATVCVNGNSYVDELIQPTLDPFVLTCLEVRQLEDLARAWDAFTRVQFELVREGFSGGCGHTLDLMESVVPSDQRDIAMHDPGYYSPVSPFIRLDMIRTENGFRVIDINTTCPLGLGDYLLLSAQYQSHNTYRNRFNTRAAFVQTVLQCFCGWRERFGHTETEPRLGVLVTPDAGEWHNFQVLASALALQEISVRFITEAPDERSDINCVLRGQVKFGHPQFRQLVQAAPRQYAVISPPGRRFMGSKFWFVALRMPGLQELFQGRLGHHDYDILNEAFPKTGILKQDGAIAFPEGSIDIRGLNRKDWLMKPASGACARGVIVGRSCSQKKWDEYLDSGAYDGAVVQEYLNIKETALVLGPDGEPQPLEGRTKYGAFLYGGTVAGCEVMLRHGSHLVHGARDTYLSTCVW